MQHSYAFTAKSANGKTGPIAVTTSTAITCPDACPLKAAGCYAEAGPLGMIWRSLTETAPGQSFKNGKSDIRALSWSALLDAIRSIPAGALWRHNQAGDLPGHGNEIDAQALRELTDANQGKRGFTYTHKPLTPANAAAIKAANDAGFTVNLSGNNLAHADQLADANIGPVVVVLPADVKGNADITTPAGRRVSVCPATYRDDVSCKTCGLCQRQTRKAIVGFPAHGVSKRKADAVARS